MAEQLEHLLETINKEVVANAQQQAKAIVDSAEEQAQQIVAAAEKRAAEMVGNAEREAQAFTDRSIKTLGHAGRDLLIKVKMGVERVLQSLVVDAVAHSLDSNVIKDMLIKMSEAYFSQAAAHRPVQVFVGERDHQELIRFFSGKYKQKLAEGLEIKLDPQIEKGFRVKIGEESAYHDFTSTAIAEELAKLLKPAMGDIILRSAIEQEPKKDTTAKQRAA